MSTYFLSEAAARDLDEIVRFTIERWGVLQATSYLQSLESLFRTVCLTPVIGRSVPDAQPGLRRFEHKAHVVFYLANDSQIEIVRVLHGKRVFRASDFKRAD